MKKKLKITLTLLVFVICVTLMTLHVVNDAARSGLTSFYDFLPLIGVAAAIATLSVCLWQSMVEEVVLAPWVSAVCFTLCILLAAYSSKFEPYLFTHEIVETLKAVGTALYMIKFVYWLMVYLRRISVFY